MKFCYIDESQQEGITVRDSIEIQDNITIIVGILVDAQRLHRSRKEWKDLLIRELEISELKYPNGLREIKGKDLYGRGGYWKKYDWERRKQLIDKFIGWTVKRKHKITFGAVSESKLKDNVNEAEQLGCNGLGSWDIAARHLILGVQKKQQEIKNNKGKTIFVFDDAKGKDKLLDFVLDPPKVTEKFYNKELNKPPLDQIVDVPFFVDSLHVWGIHLADLFAYIICRFAVISEGIIKEKYEDELNQLNSWMDNMSGIFLPDSMRWVQKSDDAFTKFLRSVAPESLLRVASK